MNQKFVVFKFILSISIAAEGSFSGTEIVEGSRRRTARRQDGSNYVTNNPQLLRETFRKKVSLFLQKRMKNTLFVKTTASLITTKRRVFYPFVNITLYYLEKLRNCYINWIDFVSPINTWTVFIPSSSTDSAEKLFQRVEMWLTICKEQSPLTKETEEWIKCRVLQKALLRKKFKQHFMSALQKNKSTQSSGSVFAERIEKGKKTKFELELIKIAESFLDGHSSFDSNLVSFKIKSF